MSSRQPPRSTRAKVRKKLAERDQLLREMDAAAKETGYQERPERLILTITASLGNGRALAEPKVH